MKRWFDAARARFSLIVSGRAAESRMDEELAFHIEMETDRLARVEGLSREEAHRRARTTFGGVTQHKEELRDGRGLAWLGTLSLDAKLALRMLAKSPGLTIIAALGMSVAVAIGAVCFSAVYRIVDAELPVSEGTRVIGIRTIDRKAADDARQMHLHYLPLWREAMPAIDEFGAYRNLSRNISTSEGFAEPARVAEMSASGFRIARMAPIAGRTFTNDDERLDAPPVAVIGYRLWQQRYAARQDIVGQSILIGETRHRIIGVMPEGFAFPVNNRIWIPLRLNPAEYEPFKAPAIDVFGRLADGASLGDARRQAEVVVKRMAASDSARHGNLISRVIPYTRTFIDNGDAVWTYHLIQVVVTLLLVVIGTNVAVLVYARTAGRMGEIAIRTSLGASRARIVGQLFAEAFALSLVGVVTGLILAWAAMMQIDAALQRIIGEQVPYWLRLRLTPGVVLYAIALGVLGAVIIGVIPALKITGGRVRASLQELSAGGSSLRLGRPWTAMIIAQVAVAVAILPLAIAGVNSWRRNTAARDVIAEKQILTARVSYDLPSDVRMDSAEHAQRQVSLRSELVNRLRADPRVGEIVLASSVPGEEDQRDFDADPRNQVKEIANQVGAAITRIEPGYFSTIDIPMLAGRGFESPDAAADNAVVVNRSFQKKMFGGALAVGARIRPSKRGPLDTRPPEPWLTIVGVVADFPVDSGPTSPRMYRPLSPRTAQGVVLNIRMSQGSATDFIPVLRTASFATSPMLRVEDIRTMAQAVEDAAAVLRLTIAVVELVTLSTILLSAAGIYALMAFTITRRRREIGIRAALGAAPRRLLAGELARVMSRIAIGIVLGIAAAGVFDQMLQGGWTGRKGIPGLVAVAALMAAIGVASALRPAIGALRIQPTEALRSE